MNDQNRISTKMCKRQLAALWFGASLFLFLVLVIQSSTGHYGDKDEVAWSWFLPTVMPTLSLIAGVLVLDATSGEKDEKKVDRFFFWLTFSVSGFYLIVIAVTVVLQVIPDNITWEDLMNRSGLWLGPLQGLATAFLGAFFIKGERGE